MYHYHLITCDDKETLKKAYSKQKEACVKGDWITLLAKDFIFIQVEQNDEQIVKLGNKNIFYTLKEKLKTLHSNYTQITSRTTGRKQTKI